MTVDVRPCMNDDLERVAEMRMEAFRKPTDRSVWLKEGRVIADGRRILGALRVPRLGQFFGGRPVPTAGITAVMVAPEARGKGVGRALVREVLFEMQSAGAGMSTLFPSTLPPYRGVGYELAGTYTRLSAPIRAVREERDAQVEAWGPEALSEVAGCYRRFAETTNGLVDRTESWWKEEVLSAAAAITSPTAPGGDYRYLVRRKREVTGYMIYTQRPTPPSTPTESPWLLSDFGYNYSLSCRDFVWNDAETAVTLLNLIANHQTMGTHVTWIGPIDDPLGLFFQEQDIRIVWSFQWMSRLLDVKESLELRGYPAIDATVEFEVEDRLFPQNAGAFRLEVSGGSVQVERINGAKMRTDVGTLAALFTGALRAADGVRAGRIVGVSQGDLEPLHLIFAGPKPWLMEIF